MMQFGMIGYVIPLVRYPVTYNGQALQYAALASQKNHMSLYLIISTVTKQWSGGSLNGIAPAGKDWTWARSVSGLKACKTCLWTWLERPSLLRPLTDSSSGTRCLGTDRAWPVSSNVGPSKEVWASVPCVVPRYFSLPRQNLWVGGNQGGAMHQGCGGDYAICRIAWEVF